MTAGELKQHPGLLLDLNTWRQEFLAAVDKYVGRAPIPERRLDRETVPLRIAGDFRRRIRDLRTQYGATGPRTMIPVLFLRKYRGPGLRENHCAVICHTYEEVKKKSEDAGFYSLSRVAYREAHRYLCMSYLRSRNKRLILRWPAYFFWGEMSGYGQSSIRWLLSVVGLILLFGLYLTPTPAAIDPYLRFANFVRPAIAYRANAPGQGAPGIVECLEFSATSFVGFSSDRVQGVNRIARAAALFEAGLGLVMFVVLGHLLSMRITGRIESVF